MSLFSRFIAFGSVIALSLPLNAGAATASAKPALLSTIVGTWQCSYTGPKGKTTSTLTFTRVNDLWDEYTQKDAAYGDRPAHTGIALFGYDAKKRQYVSMGGSTLPGDWGVGTASAAPDAMVITFTGAYPPDPTHDKTTYRFTATTATSSDTWTEKGKPMSGHGSCTKQ